MPNWDLNYGQPANVIETGKEFHEPPARGEYHPNPFKVFIDIYGATKQLVEPGNREVRGRRGIGKTMYFLYANQFLIEKFRKDNRTLSAYVDLRDISSGLSGATQSSPHFYVNQIYRQIFLYILKNVFYPENDIRGSRDLNRLSEEKNIVQRFLIKNKIEKLRGYLDGPGDRITTRQEFEERNRIQNVLSIKGKSTVGAGLDGTVPSFSAGFDAEDNEGYTFDQTSLGAFEHRPDTIRRNLDEILKAFRSDHLIVFLDEFSTNNIPRRFQPYLIKKLIETFDGTRFSLKFATIPGATTLSISHPIYGLVGIQKDERFKTFDFDDEAAKKTQIIRTGNLHVFLNNLAFSNPFTYGKYIVESIDGKAQIAAFNQFIGDHFEDESAFLEFEKSGEGLPRQLFDTFIQTRIRTGNFSRKLTKLNIWAATFNDHRQKMQTEISSDDDCKKVLAKIHSANSRIFKIEKVNEFVDAIERLTAFGFIHACPVAPIFEAEISEYPLEYYYTSYRAEVYFQLSKYVTEPPQSFQIEDMTYILKSQYKQLYQKAGVVLLKEKRVKNKSQKIG